MKNFKILCLFLLSFIVITGCVTKKKKGDQEVGAVKKFYHNVTAKYNGYWNANELMKKNVTVLNEMHQPDYSEILEIYPYTDVENPAAVAGDMEIVMKKVAKVARLHEPSHWVDDCYVMLGRAQFLKQDFETAEETFEYFNEEFDPNDPKSRLYNASKNRKKSSDEKKAEREKEKKLKAENIKKAKREREETKEDRAEAKEEKRKKTEKYKKEIKDLKEDLRNATKKRKDNEKKARDKARKNKKRVKKDPKADPRSKKEIELETKLAAVEAEYTRFKTPKEEKTETPKEGEEDIAAEEEEDVAEDKPKEKKKISDSGGLFKHKPAFHEGVYWLARTYIERDNYFSANFFLDKLINEYPTSDDIRKEIPAAKAHLFLRQKDYNQAIPHLRDAIDVTGDKKLRARYAYILGQVYQKLGQEAEAKAAFAEVKKYKPDYSMEFNSRLNLAKAEWKSGQIGRSAVISRLEKMLKDKKNFDYKDQVHYTIGEIKEADNDIPGAIASYQSSIRENTFNKAQKVESYYRIATLYYGDEKYRPSKNYYDSTLTVMPKEDLRYFDVKKYATSLVEIASNIEIIALQDSLLMLSNLSPDQQRKILTPIAEKQIAESKEEPAKKTSSPKRQLNKGFGSSESNFFAYNPTIVLTGKKLFERKWGERNLTDHWRRSNRPGVINDGDSEDEDENVSEDLTEEAINALLRTIPMTPDQKSKVHNRREEALFALGKAYRDKIQNYPKTVSTLETLLQDYPKTSYEVDAMFYIYLAYVELGNTSLASQYKKKLGIKYPDAKFTKSITDPDYVENLNKEVNKNEVFYSETYDIFNQGNHLEVLTRVDEAYKKLENTHPLLPKFALLQAMSIGSVNGKDEYIKSLQGVISRYPNTKEETRAKEILRFLRGDSKAFNKSLYDEEDDLFTLDDEKLHYVLIVLYDGSDDVLKNAEGKISQYNKKYHKNEKLRISDIPLNQDIGTQLMLVRKFKNKSKAMAYYNGVLANSKDFIDPDEIGFDIFAATQKNYREIAKRKEVLQYRAFFEKHYLIEGKKGK